MAHRKVIHDLSNVARQKLDSALKTISNEGYACWGFIFAQQPAAERLLADSKDFVSLETFNNSTSVAGGNSMAEFIAKTDKALEIVRKIPYEGFDPEHEKEQLLAPFANYKTDTPTKPD